MRATNNPGMATSPNPNSENSNASSGSGFNTSSNLGNNNLKGPLNDWFVATLIITFFPTTSSDLKTQNASYASNPHSAVAQLLKLPKPMTERKSLTIKHAIALLSVKF